MRYLVTFFWTIILGQIVGYLGSSLMNATYDFHTSLLISIVVALAIIVFGSIGTSESVPSQK